MKYKSNSSQQSAISDSESIYAALLSSTQVSWDTRLRSTLR
ncbi:MAG: hypothetical protein ACAF41_22035 [Leptolyngbya sp. BL-A-14]